MINMKKSIKSVVLLALPLGLLSFCTPKIQYPTCESDEQCLEHQEVCVDKKCVECNSDRMCQEKLGQSAAICVKNACQVVKPGQCAKDQDCAAGQKCQNFTCVDVLPVGARACKTSQDCAASEDCVKGVCQMNDQAKRLSDTCLDPQTKKLQLKPVYFDYDQSELTPDSSNALKTYVECIKTFNADSIILSGHTDERGTVEYNFSLSERRAQSVMKYFSSLGLAADKLKVVGKGKSEHVCMEQTEECHAKNRRVEFKQ